MKNSLNALIKNSGKIVKKAFKVATAIEPAEQAKRLTEQRQAFTASFLR